MGLITALGTHPGGPSCHSSSLSGVEKSHKQMCASFRKPWDAARMHTRHIEPHDRRCTSTARAPGMTNTGCLNDNVRLDDQLGHCSWQPTAHLRYCPPAQSLCSPRRHSLPGTCRSTSSMILHQTEVEYVNSSESFRYSVPSVNAAHEPTTSIRERRTLHRMRSAQHLLLK